MEKASKFYDRFGHLLLGLAAFLLIAFTLFSADQIGLSDDGSFDRVMDASSIQRTEAHDRFVYVSGYKMVLRGEGDLEQIQNLLFSDEHVDSYPSIHLLFVRVSAFGNYIYNKISGADPALYRMGILGMLYILCYSFAISRLFRSFYMKNRIADGICKALLLIVLCDTGYTAYFNSFYSEPVQMIGFVLMAAGCLRILSAPQLGFGDVVWMVLAAMLYGWSNFDNLPLTPLVIIVFSVIAFSKCRHVAILQLLAVTLTAIVGLFLLVPEGIRMESHYNAVFNGVLYDTPEEQQREFLQDLELPDKYAALAGTGAAMGQGENMLASAEFQQDFQHITTAKLFLFYMKHPGQLLKLADAAVQSSGFLRPWNLSNYSGAFPRFTQTHRFSLWSDLRVQLGFDNTVANILLVLLFIGLFLVLQRRRGKLLQVRLRMQSVLCILSVAVVLLYCLLSPVIRNGAQDLSRHLFAYAQMMDLLLFSVLFMAVHLCCTLPVRRMLPGLAGGLLTILIVTAAPMIRNTDSVAAQEAVHEVLEPGAHVQLGTWNAKPLVWQAVSEEEGVFELLSCEGLGERAFSAENGIGSNYWPDSLLREWLNGEFLGAFTATEKALISGAGTENEFLLPDGHAAQAIGGSNELCGTNIPSLAAKAYDKAMYGKTDDLVYLPDIALISALSEKQEIALQNSYWLETPCASDGSMLRAVYPDGYIYFRDTGELADVRPVVRVRPCDILSGSGSDEDPFILNLT